MEIKEKTINVGDKDYTIKKLPIGKYAEVFGALGELPSLLSSMGGISQEEIVKALPTLILKAYPELRRILSIATSIEEKEFDESLGLDDLTEIVIAIFEVNNFEKIKKNFSTLLQVMGQEKALQGVKEKLTSQNG